MKLRRFRPPIRRCFVVLVQMRLEDEWTRGNYPRSFAFDPTGEFLYCCNQRADHVTVFRVDRKTGGLTFTGQYVPVGNPSCMLFLDLKTGG